MAIFLDANVLCRLARRDDSRFEEARAGVEALLETPEELLLAPQAHREFWVVATRPRDQNGLGMSTEESNEMLTTFEELFPLRPDTPAVHQHWRRLVVQYGVMGKEAHDAGYVAAMQAHDVGRLLSFDAQDFRRYAGIQVLAPKDVLLLPSDEARPPA